MTVSLARAKKLARTLLRENRKNGRSWRAIAREDFNNTVNITTLCRFAITKATWMPKDKSILLALGLIKPRAPRPKQKTIPQMKDRELLEYCQRRINQLNDHIKSRGLKVSLGWIKEK